MQNESIIIPLGIFFIVYIIIKASLDYKTRKQLIEKGLVNKDIKFLTGFDAGFMSSLKWGLVLTGIGSALLISRMVARDVEDEVMFGAMFLAAGIGLVIHYIIAMIQSKKSPNGNGDNQNNKMITL